MAVFRINAHPAPEAQDLLDEIHFGTRVKGPLNSVVVAIPHCVPLSDVEADDPPKLFVGNDRDRHLDSVASRLEHRAGKRQSRVVEFIQAKGAAPHDVTSTTA